MGWIGDELVAYLRVLPAGAKYTEMSIGRVVNSPSRRGQSLGRFLIAAALKKISEIKEFQGNIPDIRIGAQAHLSKFYGEFGFIAEGEIYDEDGIPHIEMVRKSAPLGEIEKYCH